MREVEPGGRVGGLPADERKGHPEDSRRLPDNVWAFWGRGSPAIISGFAEQAGRTGFAVLADQVAETRPIGPSESGFAEQAKGAGWPCGGNLH